MNLSAVTIATSGLQAASQRLNVSANNVANQFSTAGEVFQPQQVSQTALSNGGVSTQTRTQQPATVSYFDPSNTAANDEGIVQFPNVNTAGEVVNQLLAGYDFQASLSVIRTSDELLGNLIDISA